MPIDPNFDIHRYTDKYKNENGIESRIFYEIQEPSQLNDFSVGVKLYENTPEMREKVRKNPEDFRPFVRFSQKNTTVIFSGTSTNKWNQLKELARNLDGGPYHVRYNGDTCVISNEQRGRNIYKIYTWYGGHGELLSFKVNSESVRTINEIASTSGVNPDTKDVETTLVQTYSDPGKPGFDTIVDWAPISNKQGDIDTYQPKRYIPYHMSEYAKHNCGVNKIDGKSNWDYTPSNMAKTKAVVDSTYDKIKTEFKTKDDIIDYYQNNPGEITPEEFTNMVNQLREQYNSNIDTQSALDDNIHLNGLKKCVIKRKDWVNVEINPITESPRFPDVYKNSPNGLTGSFLDQRKIQKAWLEGYDIIASKPNVIMLTPRYDGPIRNINDKSTVRYKELVEVEIELDAGKVLANYHGPVSDIKLSNDLEELVSQKVKANAVVIGDPTIECSMNIQIQNVSSLYSKVWYIKKVSHKVNTNSGYTCEIDFVEQNLPISRNVIKGAVRTNTAYQKINKIYSEAIESGSYYWVNKVENYVNKKYNENPDYSYHISPLGKDKPGLYMVLKSDKDMDIDKIENLTPEDIKNHVVSYEIVDAREL